MPIDLDELAKLLNLLRRSGVVQFKSETVEVSLVLPEPVATPGQAPSPGTDAPQADQYAQLLGKRGRFPGNE